MALAALLVMAGLSEPTAEAVDAAAEALFGKSAKEVLEEAQTRLRAFTGKVPPNHDLEKAIRLAELTSSLVLVDTFRRQCELENNETRTLPLPPFVGAAKNWLFGQIGLSPGMAVVSNEQIVTELNEALDKILPATKTEEIDKALAGAQKQIWDALIKGAGQPAPEDFKSLFFGEIDGQPGWSSLFLAFIREALKKNPRAEIAFVTTRLTAVRADLLRVEERLSGIKDDTAAIKTTTDALLVYAEQEARSRNVAEGFIQEMAARVARDRALDSEGQMQAVRNAIDLYEREIAGGQTQTNIDTIVDEALRRARSLVDAGKSGLARASLRKASEAMRREEDERRDRYVAGVTALYNRERDIALAAYDGEAAGEAIIALAEAIHGANTALVVQFLDSEAIALYEYFNDRGSNVHLIAIVVLRRKLVNCVVSTDRAVAQADLGNALLVLGNREAGKRRVNGLGMLEEAVAIFREVLKEQKQQGVWLDWARTNLGNALGMLGSRESGTAKLEEAVEIFREVLKEQAREREPLQWAMAQDHLGGALCSLGQRENGTAKFEEAVTRYREALKELTQQQVPHDWAATQRRLGTALSWIAERGSGTAEIEEAVVAYREAQKVWTMQRAPVDWSITEFYISGCLTLLDKRRNM
jgi:tetratricopeptide (TPR) repeat protein